MNIAVTSRDSILKNSREIVKTSGWNALNVRAVAQLCGVAVGSIYNYFSSKSELVIATVESIWTELFDFDDRFETLEDAVEDIFRGIQKGWKEYPGFFGVHPMVILEGDREKGRTLMKQTRDAMKAMLLRTIRRDQKKKGNVFGEDFTEEIFVEVLFAQILSAILNPHFRSEATMALVRKVMY